MQALVRLKLLEITFVSRISRIVVWYDEYPSSTEVKQQWATLVLGWVTASVH